MKRVRKRTKKKQVTKFPWDSAMAGWTWNNAVTNVWRMHGTYTVEDLYHEGYVVYGDCLHKYENSKVNNRRWFMSLYQTAYVNHVIDLAKEASRFVPVADVDVLLVSMDLHVEAEQERTMERLIKGLPEELTEVVRTFVTAPEEVFTVLAAMWATSGRKKRGKRQAVRALAGALGVRDRDFRTEIHEHLNEDDAS